MQADNSELLSQALARIERGDDPFDAQGHAAFDAVLKFVFEHAPAGFADGLDAEAIALVGESEEKVSAAIEKLAREAHALFGAMAIKDATAFALSLALGNVLRERIATLQANGVGRA